MRPRVVIAPETIAKEGRNGSLEGGIVGTIRAVVEPLSLKFTFGSSETFPCLVHVGIRITNIGHSPASTDQPAFPVSRPIPLNTRSIPPPLMAGTSRAVDT